MNVVITSSSNLTSSCGPHIHMIIRKSKVQTVSACNETCAQTCTSHSIHCVISLTANCAVFVLLPHLPSM